MKQGWESDNKMITKRFDEVFDLSLGRTPSRSVDAYWGGCRTWVSIADMSCGKYISETKESITDKALVDTNIPIVKKGTVIMSFKLSIGKVCIADTDLYTNEAIMAFVPKPQYKVLPEYLYYYLMFYKWDNSNEVVLGFTLNKKTISQSIVTIPSLAEQKRIVEILDREFEKIDALKENAEKNLQHAKDLFQSALKQELQPKEGWERCKLCEVCTFYNGKPHENDIDENGEYILVNSKFISSDMQVYKKTSSQFFPLFAGDIVMVMSDVPNGKALAKCQIIHKDNLYSLNQRICVFRDAKIDVKLLYYLVNRNPYLIAFDNGENQTNLRKNDIVSMPICHPTNTKEVAGIVARLDYFRNKCQALEENYTKTIALCDDMRQALLRKAFNGEL